MRRNLVPPLAQIDLYNSGGVDGEPLVWVDHNAEQARVGVDQFGLVPGLEVPEDRGLIEEGQVSHVITLLKFGRVDLTNELRLEDLFLETK